MKSALLIGINYVNTPEQRLYGCINDVQQMSKMLTEIYEYDNIRLLIDTDINSLNQPTKNNILNEMKKIIMSSQQNDEIWIHFSGHGTQVTDRNGDERDGRDECIVPSDFRNGLITDDEIFEIVKYSKCPTRIIIDACNSGTGADLGYCWNFVNNQCQPVLNTHPKNENITAPIVMISGCMDPQTSADAWSDTLRMSMGALTCAIWDILTNENTITIENLFTKIHQLMIQRGYTQRPVLSSATKDLNLKNNFITKIVPISLPLEEEINENTIETQTDIVQTTNQTTQTENQNILDLEQTVTFLQEQLNTLRSENNSLKTENNSLKTENNSLKTENNSLKTENNSLKTENNSLKTEINNSNTQRTNLQNQINNLNKVISDNQNEINRLRGQLNSFNNTIPLSQHNSIKNALENEIRLYKASISRLNTTIAILRRNAVLTQRREFK
jgi:FtsZ-binding cell division protein ZapB